MLILAVLLMEFTKSDAVNLLQNTNLIDKKECHRDKTSYKNFVTIYKIG